MKYVQWAFRKIRKGGRVKIGGHWYKPDENWMKYDGRCDGIVYLFATYPYYEGQIGCRMLAMWGTKEMSDAVHKDPYTSYPHGPELVDNSFPWYFWHEVKEGENEPVMQ